MSVLCTVLWTIKPECNNEFIKTMEEMFQETQHHPGFISIRLQRNAIDDHQFILIQEWNTVANHQAYGKFREARGDVALLVEMTAAETIVYYWHDEVLASAGAT